jgi:hypothetical protein
VYPSDSDLCFFRVWYLRIFEYATTTFQSFSVMTPALVLPLPFKVLLYYGLRSLPYMVKLVVDTRHVSGLYNDAVLSTLHIIICRPVPFHSTRDSTVLLLKFGRKHLTNSSGCSASTKSTLPCLTRQWFHHLQDQKSTKANEAIWLPKHHISLFVVAVCKICKIQARKQKAI